MNVKTIVLSLVLAVSVGAALYGQLQLFILNNCYSTLELWNDSPDDTKSAVLYNYKCDTEHGYATQISIVEKGEELPESSGNAFSSHNGKVRGHWLGPYVEFEWESNDVLTIRAFDDHADGVVKSTVFLVQISSSRN